MGRDALRRCPASQPLVHGDTPSLELCSELLVCGDARGGAMARCATSARLTGAVLRWAVIYKNLRKFD